jgi:prepilin-type N-terminal cleavage/methylation domain-containing protein
MTAPSTQRAFSLVELSIVLVILGLLIGGILSGQSLIRAAELRGGITQVTQYKTAVYSFRDKYLALPGDMTNAYSFWTTTCAASAGLCNGDGNGKWVDIGRENFMTWKHLALAGLVEGNYTGAETGGVGSNGVTIGTNVPLWKAGGGLNVRTYGGIINGRTAMNAIIAGKLYTPDPAYLDSSVLKAEDAWNMDTKTDDGKASTGSMHSLDGTEGGACISMGEYVLNQPNLGCRLWFWME